jgi:hypothetical protein
MPDERLHDDTKQCNDKRRSSTDTRDKPGDKTVVPGDSYSDQKHRRGETNDGGGDKNASSQYKGPEGHLCTRDRSGDIEGDRRCKSDGSRHV